MRPALVVVHGDQEAACRRLVAMTHPSRWRERPAPPSISVAAAGEIDASALEPLARQVSAHEDFFVVHLVPEGAAGPATIAGIREADTKLRAQFPAARLVQWCVLQLGRDLDQPEAELLVELERQRAALRLQGSLAIPTSTGRSIANDDADAVSYTADAVYALLRGAISEELPSIYAVASTSAIFRPEHAADCLAAQTAAQLIRAEVLRHSQTGERHLDLGAKLITERDWTGIVDALLGRSRQENLLVLTTLGEVLVEERPDVVLGAADEVALVGIPAALERAQQQIPAKRADLQQAIEAELASYLKSTGRTRATWEWVQGVHNGLLAAARELADRADAADAPALDAPYHEAVVAARHAPSAATAAVKVTALACLPLLLALVPGLPRTMTVLSAVIAAVALLCLGGIWSWTRHRRARATLLRLIATADRRMVGLLERGALEMLREMVKAVDEWLGDVGEPLAEEMADYPEDCAGSVRRLHASTVGAAQELEALATDVASGDLRDTRFAMVIPNPESFISEVTTQERQAAQNEARSAIRAVFRRWELKWDQERIVVECLAVAAPKFEAQLPADIGAALADTPTARARFDGLISVANEPHIASYRADPAIQAAQPWTWVLAADPAIVPGGKTDWRTIDDPWYVVRLNAVPLDAKSLERGV